jgi:hypothetical protein
VFAFCDDCLNLPFYEEESDNTIRRMKSIDLKILEFVSKEAKYMIEYLFRLQLESRLTVREILYDELNEYEEAIYVEQTMYNEKDFPKEIRC